VDLNAEGRRRTVAVTGGLLPRSLRVQAGGLSLHCLEWGRPDDPCAVLLHGNGAHARWFDALVPALVPGWRIVAPDLRGHGESDWAEPPRYAIENFGHDLGVVIDALAPGPVPVVGHSMGGRVVVWYAAERPDRVRGLVVLDSRMETIRPELASAWRAQVAGQREGRGYPTRDDALAGFRFVPEERNVPADVIADLAHHAIRERAPGDWTFRFDRAVLSREGDGAGDLLARLRRLRCPALVMAGADSWVMDAGQRAAIAEALPQATIRVFPGGHHFLLAQARVVGAELRRFLDAVP
jgi:pimeloyl-ACP methyl ester carboxylesterase